MIGLSFLAAGLTWLLLSWCIASRLPYKLGISKPVGQWVVTSIVFLLLLVGPFVDHIVGMRQFETLCDQQTNLRISANAATATRTRHAVGAENELKGYTIKITQSESLYFDRDTGQVIAQYNHFSTSGGWLGSLIMLGGRYTCSSAAWKNSISQLKPIQQKLTYQ